MGWREHLSLHPMNSQRFRIFFLLKKLKLLCLISCQEPLPPSPCNYKKSNLCFIQGSDSFGCWLFLNKHDKSNTLTSPGVIFQNGDPAERNEMFSQVYFMQIYIQTNYISIRICSNSITNYTYTSIKYIWQFNRFWQINISELTTTPEGPCNFK